MLMFNPCEEIDGPRKRNEVQNNHTYIHHSNFPTCKGPWNWIWNLQDPTSIEFPDRKQIKEPYLQVFAFLLSEFTDKTWDLKRFVKLPLALYIPSHYQPLYLGCLERPEYLGALQQRALCRFLPDRSWLTAGLDCFDFSRNQDFQGKPMIFSPDRSIFASWLAWLAFHA